jgi:cytochrome c
MRSSTHTFRKKNPLLTACFLFTILYLPACNNEPEQKNTRKMADYIKPIPGKNDSLSAEVAERGKVLIAYSDCYICHKKDERSAGPAFEDVAKRYPVNKVYIEMLAQKIIVGGSGNWGSAVMDPHSKLSVEDAKTMVTYILSMKK